MLSKRLCGWVAVLALAGCGGGDDIGWDEFRPRETHIADIAGQSFMFTGFEYGAVFDPSLVATPTSLNFGPATAVSGGHELAHSVLADGAASSGVARLEGSTLTLRFGTVSPTLPFTTSTVLSYRIESDVDDGRVRLTNLQTQRQQVSAP